MGKQRTIEIAVGAFMAAGMVALFFMAMQVSNLSTIVSSDGYQLKASFQTVGSLKVRAPVNLAGVRIGRVEAINLDQRTFDAVVTMRISRSYLQIPDDTFASILTAGLLGEQYIGLDPGGSETYLKNGDSIMHTQSAMVLETLISQFLFSKAGENTSDKKTDAK